MLTTLSEKAVKKNNVHFRAVAPERCDTVHSQRSRGAREGSTAACKSSRTLLCECGGWEAAAPCSAQPFLSTMRGFLLILLTLSVQK